jgi:hypothetical protein
MIFVLSALGIVLLVKSIDFERCMRGKKVAPEEDDDGE